MFPATGVASAGQPDRRQPQATGAFRQDAGAAVAGKRSSFGFYVWRLTKMARARWLSNGETGDSSTSRVVGSLREWVPFIGLRQFMRTTFSWRELSDEDNGPTQQRP